MIVGIIKTFSLHLSKIGIWYVVFYDIKYIGAQRSI